jgi:hypothetical protein
MAKVYCISLGADIGIRDQSPDGFLCPKKSPDYAGGINCSIQEYTKCPLFTESQETNKRVKVGRLESLHAF